MSDRIRIRIWDGDGNEGTDGEGGGGGVGVRGCGGAGVVVRWSSNPSPLSKESRMTEWRLGRTLPPVLMVKRKVPKTVRKSEIIPKTLQRHQLHEERKKRRIFNGNSTFEETFSTRFSITSYITDSFVFLSWTQSPPEFSPEK